MKNRDAKLFIEDILDCILKIESYTEGVDFDTFLSSEIIKDAVERNIEIIGEAAKYIPENIKQKYPELPVSDMIGMRNIIIHNYLGVNDESLWATIKDAIPQIKPVLETIYKNEFKE